MSRTIFIYFNSIHPKIAQIYYDIYVDLIKHNRNKLAINKGLLDSYSWPKCYDKIEYSDLTITLSTSLELSNSADDNFTTSHIQIIKLFTDRGFRISSIDDDSTELSATPNTNIYRKYN